MSVNLTRERRREIYHAVDTMRLSHREVAKRFGIAESEVRRIVAEERAFIMQHGSDDFVNVPPDKMELVALRRYVHELTHINKLLLRQIVAVQREAKAAVKAAAKQAKPPKTTTRRTAAADPKKPVDPAGPDSDRSQLPTVRTCARQRRCGR